MLSILKKYTSGKPDSDTERAIGSYDRSRNYSRKEHLCHAPFNNMYFNIHGQAGPCWLTLNDGDRYPDKSVHDIWFGERFRKIRQSIRDRDLAPFCQTCKANIEAGNHVSVLAKLYDLPYDLQEYPSEIEFELSNRCNLECVMCKGELSSSIRKNREGLPEVQLPYDAAFVEQLREFIPHLKEAKFLGGEPFLIDIYCDIWDLVEELNPGVKITVTTNGTALNNRIKQLIEKLDFHLIMSIDSFNKETYDKIRIGARFDIVLKNMEYFLDYARRNDKFLQVSINPLRKNWHELHDYVNYCIERNMFLWFNTVIYPHEEALWTLNASQLEEIHAFVSAQELIKRPAGTQKHIYENNVRVFRNLADVQLVKWLADAREREARRLSEKVGSAAEQRLKEDISRYYHADAYLVPGVRDRKIGFYTGRLDRLKEASGTEEFRRMAAELYRRPFNDILELLEKTDAKELLRILSVN